MCTFAVADARYVVDKKLVARHMCAEPAGGAIERRRLRCACELRHAHVACTCCVSIRQHTSAYVSIRPHTS